MQLSVDQRTVGRDLETLGTLPNVKGQGKDTLSQTKPVSCESRVRAFLRCEFAPRRRARDAPTARAGRRDRAGLEAEPPPGDGPAPTLY